MTGSIAALRVELLKAQTLRRAGADRAAPFAIAPLVGGLFMYILADPERARRMGLIGQKAQLAGGGSDWPAYFAFLAQAATVGGFMLFAFVVAWVFGREFSDGTVRYLLALPTSRTAIIAAKLVVVAYGAPGSPPSSLFSASLSEPLSASRGGRRTRCRRDWRTSGAALV